MGLDIIVPQNAIYFGDVKRSIAKGNAVGHIQCLRHGKDFFGFGFAGLTYNRVLLALLTLPTNNVPLGLSVKDRALGPLPA